jgi:hypothetical protein
VYEVGYYALAELKAAYTSSLRPQALVA